jgi:hypothetical protein
VDPLVVVHKLKKRLQAMPKGEDATLIAQHSGLRVVQLGDNITVHALGVIPDDDSMVLDLLGDQRHEVFSTFSHTVRLWLCSFSMDDARSLKHHEIRHRCLPEF